MANPENLIPNENRTPSERRENARKAGVASGEARRKRKTYAELIKMVGGMEVKSSQVRDMMKKMGIADEDMINDVGVVIGQIVAAQRGNTNAANYLRDTVGEKPVDKSETTLIPQKPLIDLTDRKKNGEA